ncbi:hypothetical protein GY45DRAFT_1284529 [Cubamyces sp. BRFM 1775]|nr:hypothetical protein GY45DRAFT_1284529 [Cubamyces sp. BRFM 1775]
MAPSTPRFPNLQGPRLPCPPLGRLSSPLRRKICFYIHEKLLKPLSAYYCHFRGITSDPQACILPFGFVLKHGPRVREQEGLAMNLARSMGVPAPRFISYGEPPADYHDQYAMPSILMTRLPGTELDRFEPDEIDFELIRKDLIAILASMRRFVSPWDDAVCGVDGGGIYGPLIPWAPLPPFMDEAAFHDSIGRLGGLSRVRQNNPDHADAIEAFFAFPPHAIVFTHGDLQKHNIMVGEDGHVCGIFDWEAAAWLPEYWEVTIMALFHVNPWGAFLNEAVTSRVYDAEVHGNRAVYGLLGDALH